jgi:hypothetical protein
MESKSIKELIEDIKNYYMKHYSIESDNYDEEFLNSILQRIDSKSWQEGYDACKEDNEIY